MLITLYIGSVDGCSEVVSFSAPSSQCHIWPNQSQTCKITETTRLVLMPQGQQACLLINNKDSEPLGTISVEIQRVFFQCKNKNEYFTTSYSMHVVSSKRCNWMGTCSNSKCAAVKLDTIVDELKGESSSYPGFSYCSECFSCEAACLFYRVYAKPTSDVFEVFSCPIWELKVVIKVKLSLASNIEKQELFTVSPGISVEWENLKLTMTSVTQPQVPALSGKFLSDGTRIAYVHASNFGDLTAGSIGDLQCTSHSQASDSFHECKLSPQICTCHPQELSASCSCSEKDLFSYFTLKDSLPLSMPGLSLIGSNNLVEAQFHQFLSLEMQIQMQGLHLITLIHKNKCFIKMLKLNGCYNCLSSAKLDIECSTDFGETLAHIICPSITFSIKCSVNKTISYITLHFTKATINETCKVNCPGGITETNINGILDFVIKEQRHKFDNNITIKTNDSGNLNLDLGFSLSTLFGNWKTALLSIIMTIIIFILMIFCSSIIVRYMCFYMISLRAFSFKNRKNQ